MRIDLLTLFPEFFDSPLQHGVLRVAQERQKISVHRHDFRHFGRSGYRRVDDRPFGGGPGMLLSPEPPLECLESFLVEPRPRIVVLTPQGERLSQKVSAELATWPHLVILSGHYEGFDERLLDLLKPREISVGDYVLSGGEPAALVLMDSVVRLLPGVLGDEQSSVVESFADGLLDYPQYTRPVDFRGLLVPDVLRNGNHRLIEDWRKKQALARTAARRPDLVDPAAPRVVE